MRLSTFLFGVPVAVVTVVFAICNRTEVSLSLWPLPYDITAPLYIPILLVALLFFLLGGSYVWMTGSRVRRENRRRGKAIKKLEKNMEKQAQKNIDIEAKS